MPSAPCSRASLAALLAAAQTALAEYRHLDAVAACEAALRLPRLSSGDDAQARLLLAEALSNLARHQEALTVLAPLLTASRRALLAPDLQTRLALRAAAAHSASDPDQGMACAQEALRLAETHQLSTLVGAAAFQLGSLARRIGETGLARDYFRQAQQAHSRSGQRQAFIRDQIALGSLAAAEGDALTAEAAFTRAGELLSGRSAADEPLLHGLLLTGRGSLEQWRGRLKQSVRLREEALVCLERTGMPELSLLARSNLTHALLQTGEARRAAALMEETLAEARAHGARESEAATLNNLGELRIHQGRIAEAERLIGQSLSVFRRLRLRHVEAQALGNLGHCRLAAGRLAEATEAFSAELAHCAHMGDQRGASAAWLHLAETRFAGGERARGEELLAQARAEIAALGGTPLLPLLGQLRRLEGSLALTAGRYEEARWRLEQAVSLSTLTGRRASLGAAWLGLARACQGAGDRARMETALNEAEAQFAPLEAAPQLAEIQALRASPAPEATERSETQRLIVALKRLLCAGVARELLLRELARLLAEEFQAGPVVICGQTEGRLVLLERAGCNETEAEAICDRLRRSHRREDQTGVIVEINPGEHDTLLLSCGATEKMTDELIRLCARQTEGLLEGLTGGKLR
jgi:tetratricopeptide (TPR) repeat protein